MANLPDMKTTKNVRLAIFVLAIFSAILAGCARIEKPIADDFEYRGHKYIVFRVSGNFGQTYVHDPDCPCHKK